MNITKHIRKRYCERILGMVDSNEIKKYLLEQGEEIDQKILELYNSSFFVWRGKLGGNTEKNYYIINDIILVIDDDLNLITLFKVDFGFPEKTNKKVIKDLLSEISKLQLKLQKQKEKTDLKIERLIVEIEGIDKQIKCLEHQLDILKNKQRVLNDRITVLNSEPKLIQKQIDMFAVQLCNSVCYRADLLEIGGK